MNNTCCSCKHGHDKKSDGQRTSPGTVWCAQRSVQMGRTRQMPCFMARGGMKVNHCVDCRRAKILTNTGESPRLGNVWCEKKRIEINKQRSMACFE